MTNKDPLASLRWLWQRLQPLPGGPWLFSRLLALFNPYSGSIKADVIELESGYARLKLKQRRRILNHLNSIHALALANLGELTSGLALVLGLPPQVRGIPVELSIQFLKKARGVLVAESHVVVPQINGETEYVVSCEIKDQESELVAVTSVTWKLDLKENHG